MGILHDTLNIQSEFTSKGNEEALLAVLFESLPNSNVQRATLAQMYGNVAWHLTDEELLAFMQEAEKEYLVTVYESSNFDPSIGMFTTGTQVDTEDPAKTEAYDYTIGSLDVNIITKPKKEKVLKTIGAVGTARDLHTNAGTKYM